MEREELNLSGLIVTLGMSTPVLFIVLMNSGLPAPISGIPCIGILIYMGFLQRKRMKLSKIIRSHYRQQINSLNIRRRSSD